MVFLTGTFHLLSYDEIRDMGLSNRIEKNWKS